MNNKEKEELIERIKKMRCQMNQQYSRNRNLTNQQMLQLSQRLDQLILTLMKHEKSQSL